MLWGACRSSVAVLFLLAALRPPLCGSSRPHRTQWVVEHNGNGHALLDRAGQQQRRLHSRHHRGAPKAGDPKEAEFPRIPKGGDFVPLVTGQAPDGTPVFSASPPDLSSIEAREVLAGSGRDDGTDHSRQNGSGRQHELSPEEKKRLQEEWAVLEPRLQQYMEATKEDRKEDASWSGWWRRFLLALGGGTGATVGGTGLWFLDKDLASRMQLQDEAVLCLLLFVYFLTLAFSGVLAFRQAKNRSPVTFYADPRYFASVTEACDTESFLDAFNHSPKGTYLHVTGYAPTYQDAPGSTRWRGTSYNVDFAFSLDLSCWVVPATPSTPPPESGSAGPSSGASRSLAADLSPDGVNLADVANLRDFLTRNEQPSPLNNDMAIVEMQKFITWTNWEELATNIKLQMRQLGFRGTITVECTECETMCVYKNTQWANFMHSKTLKVIIALSVFGWIFYAPYMYLSCSRLVVRSYHRVDIGIADYWRLVSDHLQQYGFDPLSLGAPRRPSFAAGYSVASEDISWSDADERTPREAEPQSRRQSRSALFGAAAARPAAPAAAAAEGAATTAA